MVIQVNAEYRITSDPSCWTVEHLKGTRKDGSERWEPVNYHCRFKSALVSLAEYRIRCIDSSAPEEIIRAIEEPKRDVISSGEVFSNLAG